MGKKRSYRYSCEDEEESWEDFHSRSKQGTYFFGRQNHTLRRALLDRHHRTPTIERKKKGVTGNPIPVTVVDAFFDDGFHAAGNYYRQHIRTVDFDREEEVLSALTEYSIGVTREYNIYDRQMVTHYDVPVHGHVLVTPPKIADPGFIGNDPKRHLLREARSKNKNADRSWPFFLGKFWDPQQLYVVDAVENEYEDFIRNCQPIGPLFGSHEYKEREKLGPVDGDHRVVRVAVKEFKERRCRRNNVSVPYSTAPKEARHFEVDLGAVMEVTHVGALAGHPGEVGSFPRYRYRSGHVQPVVWNSHASVMGVRSIDRVGWLTEYSVQYRHVATRQWVELNDRFVGNDNYKDEVRHSVSILTRYLRIVPRSWHSFCDFTFLAYGKEFVGKMRQGARRIAINSIGDDAAENDAEDVVDELPTLRQVARQAQARHLEDGETIRYTVSSNKFPAYRFDGCNGAYKDDWGVETPWKIRHNLRQRIQEDVIFVHD